MFRVSASDLRFQANGPEVGQREFAPKEIQYLNDDEALPSTGSIGKLTNSAPLSERSEGHAGDGLAGVRQEVQDTAHMALAIDVPPASLEGGDSAADGGYTVGEVGVNGLALASQLPVIL
jgi:hypothetical protein